MLDAQLIKALESRDDYERYAPYVKGQSVLAETGQIIKDLGEWFEAHPEKDVVEWGPFSAWLKVASRSALFW